MDLDDATEASPAQPAGHPALLRLHFGRQALPSTPSLTRPGHVLFPDRKDPASAHALDAAIAPLLAALAASFSTDISLLAF